MQFEDLAALVITVAALAMIVFIALESANTRRIKTIDLRAANARKGLLDRIETVEARLSILEKERELRLSKWPDKPYPESNAIAE